MGTGKGKTLSLVLLPDRSLQKACGAGCTASLSCSPQEEVLNMSHNMVPVPHMLLGGWDAGTAGHGVVPPVS